MAAGARRRCRSDYGAYSFNENAARAGRFALGDGRPSAIPDLAYAYHFDAGLYAAMLRRFAEARGVVRIEGEIADFTKDGESGDLTALVMADGRRVEGRLFIDCTGFRGMLIGGAMGAKFDNWSNFLPCDRALAVPCERVPNCGLTPVHAQSAGGNGAFRSSIARAMAMSIAAPSCPTRRLPTACSPTLTERPIREPPPTPFHDRETRSPRVGNCVALGLAAGSWSRLNRPHSPRPVGNCAAMTYFPGDTIEPAARDQFNA